MPSWAQDPAIGNRMINARAETAAEKPSFRTAMRRRRCLIVADGFYEWQKLGRLRQPMFIHLRSDRPFGIAGLWESWEGADHSSLESCTLLTTAANEVVSPFHDRMPVIIAPEDYGRWLDPGVQTAEPILPLLRSYPEGAMEAYPVRHGGSIARRKMMSGVWKERRAGRNDLRKRDKTCSWKGSSRTPNHGL